MQLTAKFDLRPGRAVTRLLRITSAQRARLGRQRRLRLATCLKGARSCQAVHRRVYVTRK